MRTRRTRARIAALAARRRPQPSSPPRAVTTTTIRRHRRRRGDRAPAGTEPMTTEPMAEPMTTEPMGTDATPMMGARAVRPGLRRVPTDGEGSFDGHGRRPGRHRGQQQPRAVDARRRRRRAAGLVDTLNGPGPFTIFAPANSAFAKIPAGRPRRRCSPTRPVTSPTSSPSTSSPASSCRAPQLVAAGTVAGLNGDLTIAVDGDTVTVDAGGGPATVVCADVPMANATVHIIDTVLLPAA